MYSRTLAFLVPIVGQVALTAALVIEARANLSTGLSPSILKLVRDNAISSSSKSWELGTLAEALLEYSYPPLSVFSARAYPPSHSTASKHAATDVLKIAENVVTAKPTNILPLMVDGAVGDPASVGPAVLIANLTLSGTTANKYKAAASDQLKYLLNDAPKSQAGAISHRQDQVQLWADFVYMAPPFIADYAVMQGGTSEQVLLQEAYDQCRLYRDVLYSSNSGLWAHIRLGSWSDTTAWGTGNAWAAAGMMRVLQTTNKSAVATRMQSQQANLILWINEILNNAFKHQHSGGYFTNVIDDSSTFPDSATTALLCATAFRMAVFTQNTSLISKATKGLAYVTANVDANGWLLNAVDPYKFNVALESGSHSPEGQSFVLLLHAAYRDYKHYKTNQAIRLALVAILQGSSS